MREQLKQWSIQLLDYKLPRWEELPTFDLYSDQVLQLIHDYLYIFINDEESIITGAMINNYVKHHMMPKPEKKKYQKIHLAYLIAITTLKQTLTIPQINAGITYQSEASGLKEAYNLFCEECERALRNVALQIHGRNDEISHDIEEYSQALYFAATGVACKLVATKILEINKEERIQNEQK